MSNESQRCPACGGRNPVDAEWCTQCFESLAVASVAPATTPAPAGPPSGPPPFAPPPASRRPLPPTDGLLPLPPDHPDAVREPADVEAGGGRFRTAEDGLEWRCDVCDGWNPIERTSCTVCGGTFLGAGDRDEPLPDVAPPLLLAATVALPGAGHAMLGLWGQAFFRALLALVWGLGGASLLTDALASGQPVLPAVPLLAGWIALVVGSVNDVLVVAGAVDGRALLEGRVLLWLVMGVVGATMAAAFIGALGAIGA